MPIKKEIYCHGEVGDTYQRGGEIGKDGRNLPIQVLDHSHSNSKFYGEEGGATEKNAVVGHELDSPGDAGPQRNTWMAFQYSKFYSLYLILLILLAETIILAGFWQFLRFTI